MSVQFDLFNPAGSPFPTDRFTTYDSGQKTLKRVKLPKPNCTSFASDCADIDVINTLDGFNTQPRITVPFSGDIDPATVTSRRVYLVNLGDTLTGLRLRPKGRRQPGGVGRRRPRRWRSRPMRCSTSTRATCWW